MLSRMCVVACAVALGCLMVMSRGAWAQQTQPGDSAKPVAPDHTYPPMDPKLPTLWIIGDSTVRNGRDTGSNGQWGWGNPLGAFFDQTRINIQNRAMGGTSSRTFYRDLWPSIREQIKPGDFLIMQFGHNDNGPLNEPPGPRARARGTIRGNGEQFEEIDNQLTGKRETVHTYGWYLRAFINEAKEKGAVQGVICSPIPRNRWKDGKIGRDSYSGPAREAAEQIGQPFLDLNARVIAKYESEGEQKVTETYFPEKEVIHPCWAGSVLNAQTVIEGLKELDSPLVKYLKPEAPHDLKHPTGKAR